MRPAPALVTFALVGLAATLMGTGIVAISGQSPAWPVAIALFLGTVGAMFCSGDLTRASFVGFLFTLPIDIAKSVLPPDVVFYYPGLWLSLSDVFLFSFILLWFFGGKLAGRQALLPNPLRRISVVYLAYIWFSALIAVNPGHGAAMALTYTKMVVAFFAIADYLRRPSDLALMLKALACGLAMQLVMIAAQLVTRSYLPLPGMNLADTGNLAFSGGVSGFRPTGFLKHPIALADYLVFVIPPAIALLLADGPRMPKSRTSVFLLAAGAGMGLLATLSRGGWIAIVIAMSFMALVGVRRSMFRRQALFGGVLVVLSLLCVTAIVYPASYLRLVESDQRSSEARLLMIDQALLIGNANPVLGVGLGGYHRASKTHKPASFASANEILREAIVNTLGVVHNKYLLVYAEQGVVGVVLLLALLWKSVRVFFAVRVWNGRSEQLLGLGIAAALVGQAVMYLFDHFYLEVGLLIFWVFAAALVALARLQSARPSSGGVL